MRALAGPADPPRCPHCPRRGLRPPPQGSAPGGQGSREQDWPYQVVTMRRRASSLRRACSLRTGSSFSRACPAGSAWGPPPARWTDRRTIPVLEIGSLRRQTTHCHQSPEPDLRASALPLLHSVKPLPARGALCTARPGPSEGAGRGPYRSPSLRAFICFPTRQANSGPVRAPGRKLSARPPSHTSMLSGCPYRSRILSATLPLAVAAPRSARVSSLDKPQNCRHSLYPAGRGPRPPVPRVWTPPARPPAAAVAAGSWPQQRL